MRRYINLRAFGAASAVLALAACSPTPVNRADATTAKATSAQVSAVAAPVAEAPPADAATMVVYKTPTCGCCSAWVDHVRENGFKVEVRDMNDVSPIKADLGVPAHLASCHTGVVGGYAIEGHVPADVIVKLLRERPEVAGIAVPGMPMGSPGMEGPRKDPYDVVAFQANGKTRVYLSR